MLYSQKDYEDCRKIVIRRRIAAWVPAGILAASGIAVFIIGQNERSETLWYITVALWLIAVFYLLFVYGVAVQTAKTYRKNLEYMLNGIKRETVGTMKTYESQAIDRDGIICHPMMVNIGQKNDPEDDRLFYYDDLLPSPAALLGKTVRIISNDKMIASLEEISESDTISDFGEDSKILEDSSA